MRRYWLSFGPVALLLASAPAFGQAAADEALDRDRPQPAAGVDLHYSTDADFTEVLKAGINLDLRSKGPDDYIGIRVEKARFNPSGQGWESRERAFVRAADSSGAWKWNAQLGTDGDKLIGSAGVHDEAPFRKELFFERDILETPRGLSEGLYYTLAGAAIDIPADDRNVFTVLGALQEFTGDNVRTHVRANYVHVLRPEWGLSAQLRTRYFRNSVPREYDYYSPRWYAQVLPVLQLRRFDRGWMYLFAGGLGAQRDSSSGWRRSSYFNARVTSPPRDNWAVTGAFLFSETPTVTGQSYNYMQINFGVTRAF
jgi:hypothetical protein